MKKPKDYQIALNQEQVSELWKAGQIDGFQFMRVAAWKSAKALGEITLNSEREFEIRTKALFEAIAPWTETNVINQPIDWDHWQETAAHAIGSKKLGTGLLGLRGVGYPMATAVLSTLLPNVFPVLDKWAIVGLYGETEKSAASTKWHKSAVYRKYAFDIATSTKPDLLSTTCIHYRDQILMNAAREARAAGLE